MTKKTSFKKKNRKKLLEGNIEAEGYLKTTRKANVGHLGVLLRRKPRVC